MTGPTIGEALRRAALSNQMTTEQAHAVATVLATLEVAHGDGAEVPAAQKAALLDAVLGAYRTEMGRLSRVYGDEVGTRTGAAAARRRAEVAARRAAEPDAVEVAPNVTRLRPDPRPDETA